MIRHVYIETLKITAIFMENPCIDRALLSGKEN